jgi:hypothetical protein
MRVCVFIPFNPLKGRVRNSCIIRKGHRIKTGLKDSFCKNYIKLYKIQKTKKLGEDQIK